jgi:hypothetical protein
MAHGSYVSVWLVALLLIIVWPLFFLALWWVILFVMSAVGGWRRLAHQYPAIGIPAGGRSFTFISGMLGIARYNRTLTAVTSDAGLYLSVRKVFRFGHPPLFIPWNEIANPERSSFMRREYIAFEIGTPPLAKMKLQSEVFEGTEVANAARKA